MNNKTKLAFIARVTIFFALYGVHLFLTKGYARNQEAYNDVKMSDINIYRRLLSFEEIDTTVSTSEYNRSNTSNTNIGNVSQELNNTRLLGSNIPHNKTTAYKDRGNGWLTSALHVLLSCYCFWMLALVCDEYFICSIDILCRKFKIKQKIAASTFMAMATSSPEFVISCVGTFITEGDIGVQTVVGSAVFNVLVVPACCGIIAGSAVHLDWKSISRDCMYYGISVIALIIVIYDGIVMWYEAALLVLAYLIYLIIMYMNNSMAKRANIILPSLRRSPGLYKEVSELTPFFRKHEMLENQRIVVEQAMIVEVPFMDVSIEDDLKTENDFATSPWKVPEDCNRFMYFFKWPITLLLWLTIPDCRRHKKFYILSFIVCVVWVGLVSYFVASIVQSVNSVMNLTILSAGTSIPEAVSSVIMTSRGYGSMGISNSIGSNIFNILLCLGLPWLIKTLINPTNPGQPWIILNTKGVPYLEVTLLVTLFLMYITFCFNKFKLDRKLGIICLCFYGVFLVFTSLVDLRAFLESWCTQNVFRVATTK